MNKNINQKKITLKEAQAKFNIPKFQRHLVWKKEQKEDLLKSIILQWPIGNLIVWECGDKELLIDGLQRYSSLKTISSCMYIFLDFKWLFLTFDKDFFQRNSAKIESLVRDFKSLMKKEISKTNDESKIEFDEINKLFEEKTVNQKTRLNDEYEEFWLNHNEVIKQTHKILQRQSISTKDWNNYNLFCLYWKTGQEEDVISGFEKLNNKGTSLSKVDLLFSRWSNMDGGVSFELSKSEKDTINNFYFEKSLNNEKMPQVDENNLTIPEILWLILDKINTTKSLLGTLLTNEKTKNNKIYLLAFILLFAFEGDEEEDGNYGINKNKRKKEEALSHWIKSLKKEQINFLANNITLINNKITKEIIFIQTKKGNYAQMSKYGVNKYTFLTMYGMVIWYSKQHILKPASEFNTFLTTDEKLKSFFKYIDWKIIKIIVSKIMKSGTGDNSFKLIISEENLIENNSKDNIEKEWKSFKSKFNSLKDEDSKKTNFASYYQIIFAISSYIFRKQNNDFNNQDNGYNLGRLVSSSLLKKKKLTTLSSLGNLGVFGFPKLIKGNPAISEELFENDFLTKYLKRSNTQIYENLKNTYLNQLEPYSKISTIQSFKKAYKEFIQWREDLILKIFSETYLDIKEEII